MLYIIPTRGRPHKLRELLDSWRATRTTARLLIAIDEDDPEIEAYRSTFAEWLEDTRASNTEDWEEWVRMSSAPRMRLGGTLNHYALEYAEWENIIGFMGDDHRPRTHGWDTHIVLAMQSMGGTGVVYGNDKLQGANLPTAVAISADIVQELGYFVPPGAIHLYLDNFWKHLGESLGRLRYLPDVIIEHMHPVAGKAEMDERYAEVNSGQMYQEDEATYRQWLNSGETERIVKWLEDR